MTAVRKRRVRASRPKVSRGSNKENTTKLDTLLTEYMRVVKKAADAADRMGVIMGEAEALMKTTDMKHYMNNVAVADMIATKTNDKTIIDPEGFREVCTTDEDFYSAVTIGIGKAKKVVAEKTLDTVSEKIKGGTGAPHLKIRARTAKDE